MIPDVAGPFELYPFGDAYRAGAEWWRSGSDVRGFERVDGVTVTAATRAPWGWYISVPWAGEKSISVFELDQLVGDMAGEGADMITKLLWFIDREWPAPMPELRVGQVWIAPGIEMSINAVHVSEGRRFAFVLGVSEDTPGVIVMTSAELDGMILVRGEGAPWAPPGWTIEEWRKMAREEEESSTPTAEDLEDHFTATEPEPVGQIRHLHQRREGEEVCFHCGKPTWPDGEECLGRGPFDDDAPTSDLFSFDPEADQ